MNVTKIEKTPSILEQARAEVAKDKADRAKREMVKVLRDIDAAQAVVTGLKLKLADLEQQVNDGTF
jgi:hypothetical protein